MMYFSIGVSVPTWGENMGDGFPVMVHSKVSPTDIVHVEFKVSLNIFAICC